MSRVIIRKASYDYEVLRPLLFGMLDAICGDKIKNGCRVLIKPNLLAPASPGKALLTHPQIVRASVEYVLQKNAIPQISDSPALGSFEKVFRESGIEEAVRGLPVECRAFSSSLSIDAGKHFHKIEIAEDALKADVVINLPKLKTHTQMLLTLGVKNLFGCIVGLRKPEWHFRTGVNRDMFAELLVRIYQEIKPSITILDGILAMEGQGPGKRGVPKHLGVILGSSDAVSLDIVVCRMLGLDPKKLLTNKIAMDMGLGSEFPEIDGELPEIQGFRLPVITPLVFGPKLLHGFMRRHLVQRPVCNDDRCRLCGECWKYCPAKAITLENKKISFDYDKCIRCYCCIEVCPHAALFAQETFTGRMVRKIIKK